MRRRRVGTVAPFRIEFTKSPIWPDDSRYYETRLTNVAHEPVRVERFGGFLHGWFRLRLYNVSDDLYSAAQFVDWYNVKGKEDWIQPGEMAIDYTNYGGPGAWWVYFGSTASGGNPTRRTA